MIISELETGVSRDWLCKGHRTHSPVGINNLLVQLSETRTLLLTELCTPTPPLHTCKALSTLLSMTKQWQDKYCDFCSMSLKTQWQKCKQLVQLVYSVSLRSAKTHWDHARTCNETVLPGDWGQVVTVDVAFKLKHFSRLHNQRRRRRERKMLLMVEIQQSPYLDLCVFAYVCPSDNL